MNKDFIFYRIENKEGKGCYSSYRNDPDHYYRNLGFDFHQDFDIDFIVANPVHQFIFGFPNLKSIKEWFREKRYISHLDKDGFKLNAYSIDKSKICLSDSKIQLIFKRQDSKLIKSFSLGKLSKYFS